MSIVLMFPLAACSQFSNMMMKNTLFPVLLVLLPSVFQGPFPNKAPTKKTKRNRQNDMATVCLPSPSFPRLRTLTGPEEWRSPVPATSEWKVSGPGELDRGP